MVVKNSSVQDTGLFTATQQIFTVEKLEKETIWHVASNMYGNRKNNDWNWLNLHKSQPDPDFSVFSKVLSGNFFFFSQKEHFDTF